MGIRKFFFKYRSYTPIPIVLLIIYCSEPTKSFIMIGLALIAPGEFIRISAVRYAGGATRTRNVGAPYLCTSGPYSLTRNPLYCGNVIIYIGTVFFAGGNLDVAYSSSSSNVFYFSILPYNIFRRRNLNNKI